ncbi:MAG: hypothetical protein KJ676_01725 [Alphaproteobacteria bacterium]|jgi:hypothetical protein|uniref:hypothetical protein n=1 Tax=Brevundimonas sp. TaxID=1871086 RepID=UPI002733D877|nr:hypothetical protein [Brevundimonas sp.]MBU1323941.1 hypothetical protein [Alphaproteobacteria bacterium]MBU1526103.1 hypothetical protein [Alphaproteobacteria bacterium]MBU2118689.1 hypothetical protein [Alphaproteobacteria bacterium]MBU2350584.1 hypothetical protein [Alphaproteobacteria bacterium]MBU2382440.1 hypothetical protein [Alphaproteobacteria bacterium]
MRKARKPISNDGLGIHQVRARLEHSFGLTVPTGSLCAPGAGPKGGQCIDLETYRLKRGGVGDEFDGGPVATTEGRQRLLAEIRLSASADDHAGREWAKVADFLARQFRTRPIMASDPPG